MTTYVDTSVVVSLFADDANTDRARRFALVAESLIISDLTVAEFSSTLAIQYRNGRATEAGVRAAFATFDHWCELVPRRVEVLSADIRGGGAIIRQLQHSLRAPDAMHLVIARRLGVALATFDNAMARAAPGLGIELAPLPAA